jgi:UDP-glucose 4-epimerase
VVDLAKAHVIAINRLVEGKNKESYEVFNLGTGDGITVLEAIQAFEKVNNVKLNYTIGPRRNGDVIAIYANKDKAEKELGWKPAFSLNDIMETAWKWEQKLQSDEQMFTRQNFKLN